MIAVLKWAVALWFISICAANAQQRTEIKKGDLTGTNMEITMGMLEVAPGQSIARHTHPGEEAYYVLEGATIELPDGKKVPLATGTGSINVRGVPHAGFKVVGDKPLKLLTVHIVDKDKPMTEWVK